jgi:DNA-directed RNA polymerase specialized sigma subunit
VNAFEKKRAAHTLKRSDLYAVLAPYYDRLTGEALKKFRGGNIDIDDIKAYAKEALSSCLSTYNPEKKVPLQAYVRATIASRVIDRLRFEGIFTRFEGSMINAIRVVAPDWTAGEKLPEKSLKKAAVALKVSVPSLRSSIAAYELKSERLYIDHNAGGDSEESFSIQIKAADSFTPEFHIDATADRELRSKILERIFTNQDPKTYQVVLNWFIGDGDRSTDEVKNTMADTGLTYMNLATFVNGVIGEAIETNGIDDGFEWESLDELEQFVDTNEQDEATRRDIRVYSKAHRARAIEREESNRRDIEAYSKAYRARHASPNAPHDAG